MLAILLVAVVGPLVVATDHARAAVAAFNDAKSIPTKDRVFVRYVWWGKAWAEPISATDKRPKYLLLTRASQALTSLAGTFPTPQEVCPGLVRVDLRQQASVADHKDVYRILQVWENFRKVEFAFLGQRKYLENAKVTVYYPPGFYTLQGGSKKWFDETYEEVKIKAGDVNIEPCPYANPSIEFPPGNPVSVQDALRGLLYTEVPIVWGPSWMVRIQRQRDINNSDSKVGYFDWFGIKDRNDYFNLLVVDEKELKKRQFYWGAYVPESGISNQERIVILLQNTWGTLDVFTQKNRGQVARNLRDGELKHDAERWIGAKSDGLWLNGLFAANGNVQDAAPVKVGTDTSAINRSKDKEIGPDTCINCHGPLTHNYIITFDDWLRNNVTKGKATLRDKSEEVRLELDAKFFRDISLKFKHSRESFADAVARLTRNPDNPKDPGMTIAQFTTFFRGAYYDYVVPVNGKERGVSVELAATWVGTNKDNLSKTLKAYNSSKGLSDMYAVRYIYDPPGVMNIFAFEDTYQFLAVTASGIRVPELIIKEGAFINGKEVKP